MSSTDQLSASNNFDNEWGFYIDLESLPPVLQGPTIRQKNAIMTTNILQNTIKTMKKTMTATIIHICLIQRARINLYQKM